MAPIPFDAREGHIWLDGQLVPWKEAQLHVLSHALHYGSGVFEGQRAYNGTFFKLAEHTERLFTSARLMNISIPFTPSEINAACERLLAAQGHQDAYCRPIAWRGSGDMGVSAPFAGVRVAIAIWEWPSYFDPETKKKGIRLDVARWRRPSPQTEPAFAKASGLYMICTLSKEDAAARGYQDALMLDWRGRIAESTGSNIFFVQDGKLHTPAPDCFLDGITRRTVIDLAREMGMEVIERAIMPGEMEGFAECFLTGTAVEVTPVGEIGPYSFTPGKITQALSDAYGDLVRGKRDLPKHALKARTPIRPDRPRI